MSEWRERDHRLAWELQSDRINDEDLLSEYRDRYYPTIPKEKFDQWARDPYGQEKIDSYLE
jgi:hypothetical protein